MHLPSVKSIGWTVVKMCDTQDTHTDIQRCIPFQVDCTSMNEYVVFLCFPPISFVSDCFLLFLVPLSAAFFTILYWQVSEAKGSIFCNGFSFYCFLNTLFYKTWWTSSTVGWGQSVPLDRPVFVHCLWLFNIIKVFQWILPLKMVNNW